MNQADTRQHSILNELYVQAADNLLSALGMEARLVLEPDAGASVRSYLSVLGATCKGVALSSILKIDPDLLISVHPQGSADIPQRDLEDWCRELNNQLVGRMKNKLFRYGVVITLGLPVLLTGTGVKAFAPPNATVNEHFFRCGAGQMTLTLTTLVDEDIEFHESELSEECDAALLEGSVALF
jgi:hypothetical protein